MKQYSLCLMILFLVAFNLGGSNGFYLKNSLGGRGDPKTSKTSSTTSSAVATVDSSKQTNNSDNSDNNAHSSDDKLNIHALSIDFVINLSKKLSETRGEDEIQSQMIKECPNIDIFSSIRNEILNCRVMLKVISTETDMSKNIQIGYLKKMLKIIYDSCPSYIKNAPMNEYIKSVRNKLSEINKENFDQYQVLASSFVRRVSNILNVDSKDVDLKLEEIKKTLSKVGDKGANKNQDKQQTTKTKTSKNIKTKSESKTQSNNSLPANTKEEQAFIKETELDKIRYLTLSSLLAKTIITISESK